MGKLTGPYPLTEGHILSDFDSGEEVLDLWLQEHARSAISARSAQVFVVCDGDQVVGYSALATSAILYRELPTSQRSGLARHPVPTLLLARLAVDKRQQGQGIATALVRDAVAKAIAIQAMAGVVTLIAHAKNQAAKDFYMSLGFVQSPVIENLVCFHLNT
jgi:ribosomal protein S18 acetylase RimI-like enzyme